MVKRLEEIWKKNSHSWLSVTVDRPLKLPEATIILCHGLTGDKVGPQQLLSNLSFNLAKTFQLEVIRFDFCGSGLSSGAFDATSFQSMLEDALFVANKTTHPVIWMGISTGGLIALMAAAKRRQKEPLVIISNGIAEDLNFQGLDSSLVSLRNGQLYLNKDYFIDRLKLSPRKNFLKKCEKVSVVLGENDKKHFKEKESLTNLNVNTYVVDSADHLFTKPLTRFVMYKIVGDIIHEYKKYYSLSYRKR